MTSGGRFTMLFFDRVATSVTDDLGNWCEKRSFYARCQSTKLFERPGWDGSSRESEIQTWILLHFTLALPWDYRARTNKAGLRVVGEAEDTDLINGEYNQCILLNFLKITMSAKSLTGGELRRSMHVDYK